MSTELRIDPEVTRGDRRAFLELPYRLYRDVPHWVPPLRIAEKEVFDPSKNPFFAHAEVQHFLARRDGRVVGRIAAIENRLHNETYADRIGFFGFFDVEPDPDAARGLVQAARAWTEARGLAPMRGPVNYSTNDMCGTLIDGFDLDPVILMPYNRPDYDDLLLGAGLVGAKDLVAIEITQEGEVPARMRRVVERRVAKSNTILRPIDVKHIDDEVDKLLDVYNRCWVDNWGFVPATKAEFRHAAKSMVPVLEPHLSVVAETDGRPVGMSLVLRDVNRLLKGTNGRLWRALPKLIFGLKKIDTMRIIALGVIPEARGRGILEAIFLNCVDEGIRLGYPVGEAGWILEDNRLMQAPILAVGGRITKRYRIYETPTP